MIKATCQAPGCNDPVHSRGLCNRHYRRSLGGYVPDTQLSDRFWSKVQKTDTCWLWTASCNKDGYGHAYVNGRLYGAHRLAYLALVGPIPDGMQIDHKCRVRNCVNPDHLQTATCSTNQQNISPKGRWGTSGVRGVSWQKQCQKWHVHATINGVTHYGGLFATLAEATAAAIALRSSIMTNNLSDLDGVLPA